jgi:hypothetical protein
MKMSLHLALGLAIGLVAIRLTAVPAAAQPVPPGQEGDLAKILAPVHGRKTCFERTYDADHVKRHPKQKVTALSFQIRYHRHPPARAFPDGQRNYYYVLSARVRGENKALYSSGECVPGRSGFACSPDCDGGGFGVDLERGGDALLVRLHDRLRMTLGCDGDDEGATYELTPGADDKVFRVEKASPSACQALDRRYEED